MALRKAWLLPAVLAVSTDLGTGVFVHQHQPDYPVQLITFQIMMVGAAMLVAAPQHWVRWVSLPLLLGGAFVAGMSIGMFYIPTVAAAAFVVSRRLRESQATPNFLDTKPQNGITYTESELDAIKYRQSR
jgi:hypothetical protein